MPWKSEAQRRWGNSPAGRAALGSAGVAEWNSASKGLSLPARKADGGEVSPKRFMQLAFSPTTPDTRGPSGPPPIRPGNTPPIRGPYPHEPFPGIGPGRPGERLADGGPTEDSITAELARRAAAQRLRDMQMHRLPHFAPGGALGIPSDTSGQADAPTWAGAPGWGGMGKGSMFGGQPGGFGGQGQGSLPPQLSNFLSMLQQKMGGGSGLPTGGGLGGVNNGLPVGGGLPAPSPMSGLPTSFGSPMSGLPNSNPLAPASGLPIGSPMASPGSPGGSFGDAGAPLGLPDFGTMGAGAPASGLPAASGLPSMGDPTAGGIPSFASLFGAGQPGYGSPLGFGTGSAQGMGSGLPTSQSMGQPQASGLPQGYPQASGVWGSGAGKGLRTTMAAGGIPQAPWYERGAMFRLNRATNGFLKSNVPGRTDKLNLHVAPGSYVLPSETVSHLGQNNSNAGAKVLDRLFSSASKANLGLRGRPRMGRMFMSGMAEGGDVGEGDDNVPIMAAGGEFIVSPEQVAHVGGGDLNKGHKVLDKFVKLVREQHLKTIRKLPPPKT